MDFACCILAGVEFGVIICCYGYIWKKAGPYRRIALAAGQEPQFSERLFQTSHYVLKAVMIFLAKLIFLKAIRDKPESIGNGLTSSGPVYLYRPYPG